MSDEKPIIRLLAYPKEIDNFLEKFFADRDIYYSSREMGIRDDNVQSEVWIFGWDDDTSTLKVLEGF